MQCIYDVCDDDDDGGVVVCGTYEISLMIK